MGWMPVALPEKSQSASPQGRSIQEAVTPISTDGEQNAYQTISAGSSSGFAKRFRARLSLPARDEKN
jgi:hypothetical protein